MAGLLAARVAAPHFERVTIVDRDHLSGVDSPRKSAPQGHHIHALLARGQQILEELFPGLTADLVADGAPIGDFGTSLQWHFGGSMIRQTPTDLTCLAADRPALESNVRQRVAKIANVNFLEETHVQGLIHDVCGSEVHGVELHDDAGTQTLLEGDLVIDATGRGTRMPKWLESMGYGAVPEEKVRMNLVYTTHDFYPPMPVDVLGDDIAWLAVATPDSPRGAIFARLGDRYSISLTGIGGDVPPRDRAGMLEYVKSLPVEGIYESVASAEAMGAAHSFHFPASIRRRYDKLPSLPEGLLCLGDAYSNFNPVYGQGMTVAALAADQLRVHLERGHGGTQGFMRKMSRTVSSPWAMAASADLAYPSVAGERTLSTRFANGYVSRLQRAAADDPVLSRAFLRVAGLVDPLYSLFDPRIVARVMSR